MNPRHIVCVVFMRAGVLHRMGKCRISSNLIMTAINPGTRENTKKTNSKTDI
jgi:hypothetical protein